MFLFNFSLEKEHKNDSFFELYSKLVIIINNYYIYNYYYIQ